MKVRNPKCPKCSGKTWKNGRVRKQNKQRFKCSKCSYQFVEDPHPVVETKPDWMRLLACLLYMMGMSMNAIARLLLVSVPTVLEWIRCFAKANYFKPTPGESVLMELDEMWHYVAKKNKNYGSGRLLIELETSLLIGNAGIVVKIH